MPTPIECKRWSGSSGNGRTSAKARRQRLIDRPVHYGQSFDKPATKAIRKARNEAGPNLLEASEVREILKAADPILRAMAYLGVNCGLGNSEIGNLPISAIDLVGGWLNFPRPMLAWGT